MSGRRNDVHGPCSATVRHENYRRSKRCVRVGRRDRGGLRSVPVRTLRRCCRPGCKNPAVATLTYVYSDSTAVVGPLATVAEPHSWDLCDTHGSRITAPKGWELVRYEGGFSSSTPDEDDLTALAEAVREAGLVSVPVAKSDADADPKIATACRPPTARTGRRGHLRVLPDPAN